MNVLVFTSSMIDADFSLYQNSAKIKPNPSNQYFYSKLIKCLALNNNVAVVSHRPFVKGMFNERRLDFETNTSGKINYYYSKIEGNRYYKIFNEKNQIYFAAKKAIESFNSMDFVIVTDTLRYNLLKAAKQIADDYGVKIIGMLTDNPLNLTNVKASYASSLKKYAVHISRRKNVSPIRYENRSLPFEDECACLCDIEKNGAPSNKPKLNKRIKVKIDFISVLPAPKADNIAISFLRSKTRRRIPL